MSSLEDLAAADDPTGTPILLSWEIDGRSGAPGDDRPQAVRPPRKPRRIRDAPRTLTIPTPARIVEDGSGTTVNVSVAIEELAVRSWLTV